jgi:GTP-binding protein
MHRSFLSSAQQVHYKSKDGQNGQGKSRHGPQAENLVVQVPPGTVVRDLQGRFAGELVRRRRSDNDVTAVVMIG